jgi:hypothetical protein
MYARLQTNLHRHYRVGDRSWGTEAGMDRILESACNAPPAEDEVNQIIATTRRRERHRASRRERLLDDIATVHPEGRFDSP